MRVITITLLAALTACVADEEVPPPDSFEVEPGLFVPLAWDESIDGKADLPNGSFHAAALDTNNYWWITRRFLDAGHDATPTSALRAFEWPLANASNATVLTRVGTPIRVGYEVYEHTGLDVIRASDSESATVVAPVGGVAILTTWSGALALDRPYSTVISILDSETRLVVQLMHVAPDAALPRGRFFNVVRGQVIGELADPGVAGGRHVHVNVIDAKTRQLVDPQLVFPAYSDTSAPVIKDTYLLDSRGRRLGALVSGPLDIVAEIFDRDDYSPRNLEPSVLGYTATDQNGRVVRQLEPCRLSDAFASIVRTGYSSTIRLIDFNSARSQFRGFWPSSDLGNPDRTFRYAVTNLAQSNGRCSVYGVDATGSVKVTDDITRLDVTVRATDGHGNTFERAASFTREADVELHTDSGK